MNITARAKREQEQYDGGALQRAGLDKWLNHANQALYREILNDVKGPMMRASGGNVLEVGSQCWAGWLENLKVAPREICCINIAESELEKGRNWAARSQLKPTFHLMDAHALEFEDEHFDLVIGSAILHHLDLATALPEINRVLKPGGIMLFAEPLDINPAAKLLRSMTPRARTTDEQALRREELAAIGRQFDMSILSYQLFSVPASCLSVLLFRDESNPLMRLARFVDRNLQRVVPPMKYLYRYALICGVKKSAGG